MLGVRFLLTPAYLQLEYANSRIPARRLRIHHRRAAALGHVWHQLPVERRTTFVPRRTPACERAACIRGTGGQPHAGRQGGRQPDSFGHGTPSLALIALIGLSAWRAGWLGTFRAGVRIGGVLTLAIAGIAGVLGTLGASGSGALFWEFFSGFHGLFFSGDSWLFEYSDSLIRLYPLRFWQDSLLYIGLLAAVAAAALALGLRQTATTDPASQTRLCTRAKARAGA